MSYDLDVRVYYLLKQIDKKSQILNIKKFTPRINSKSNVAKLSPILKPSISWGLRWLYFQLFKPPIHTEDYEGAITRANCFDKNGYTYFEALTLFDL